VAAPGCRLGEGDDGGDEAADEVVVEQPGGEVGMRRERGDDLAHPAVAAWSSAGRGGIAAGPEAGASTAAGVAGVSPASGGAGRRSRQIQ
jgi:hypothetical protein